MMASISACVISENPCRYSQRNVPPGGSVRGLVQYTPVVSRRSWPPYAYSLPLMTTPECSSDVPMCQSTDEMRPGGRRS